MAPAALAARARNLLSAWESPSPHPDQVTPKGSPMAKHQARRGAKTAFIREGLRRFPDLMPKDLAGRLDAEANEKGLNIGPIRGQDVSLVKSASEKQAAAGGGAAAAAGAGTATRSGR